MRGDYTQSEESLTEEYHDRNERESCLSCEGSKKTFLECLLQFLLSLPCSINPMFILPTLISQHTQKHLLYPPFFSLFSPLFQNSAALNYGGLYTYEMT